MQSKSDSTSAFWFLGYFALAVVVGALFHRAGGSSYFGEHPFSSLSICAFLATLPLCNRGFYTFLRPLIPFALIAFFASQRSSELGYVQSFQSGSELLHFVFIVAASFFTVLLTPDDKAVAKKKVSRSNSQKSSSGVSSAKGASAQSRAPRKAKGDPFDRLVGQPGAVQALKETSSMVRSGLRVGKANAPHAVLLFLGPTGVGKTEAARALAASVYGSDSALIRFDMGQFTDAHQANRFYGPPPGYAGAEEGGQLTRAVEARPKSVVLLDEVEKAHPQIWDAFLPVFDEGYIVDGSTNRKVSMIDTVIVLTSNLLVGVDNISAMSTSELKELIQSKADFRPELLGRINEVLVFEPLSNDTIAEILRRRVDASLWNLAEQGVPLEIDDNDIATMVGEVRDAKFGVRQIDDVVRKYLRAAIAEKNGGEPKQLD